MCYWLFRLVFIVVLRLAFRMKVEGLENIPRKSNFIIIANHSSYLDPLVVMAAVPRKIHCIAMRSLYRYTWLKWFLRLIEAVPCGSSSEKTVKMLMENKNIGLFPEGGLSRDGSLREFRRGVAVLALKTGRPVVPCAIIGTYQALPSRGVKFPRFVPLKLKIGRPQYFLKEPEEIIDDIYLQEGIFKLRNIVKEMLNVG